VNINKECKLFLRDVQLYDISSCHYQIIKRLGYNTSQIPVDDKLARNTYIGMMMRDNPRLAPILRSITTSTIDEYILINDIKPHEIITRQYDGFITTRVLDRNKITQGLPLEWQASIVYMLISSDRKSFLTLDANNEVSIKGIPFRYKAMDKMLERLIRLTSYPRTSLFIGMQELKNEILTSEDPTLYCIPTTEEKSNVFLKGYGEIQVSQTLVKIMDTSDIDKERYYEFYIRPFAESILIEFL